jgi:DNA-binding NarL/FixJ family response regulator
MSTIELRPCGESRRRVDAPMSALLTPREWEVATTVARGATNREASQALFLSTKTIEMHLSRVYRKLGIRSRCQLAVLFAQQALSAESAESAESSELAS